MNWLSRLFATRRELKRLASEEKFWRERCDALEKKLEGKDAVIERKNNLLLELGFRWSDRFLTSQAKTYAITDEAKAHINPVDSRPPKADLQAYLQSQYDKIMADAEMSGTPREQAEAYYHQNEEIFKEEFTTDFGFSN